MAQWRAIILINHYRTVDRGCTEYTAISCNRMPRNRPLSNGGTSRVAPGAEMATKRYMKKWHPDNHNYFQYCSYVTKGRPRVSHHQLAQGLSLLHYDNCVVKMRVGHDLDALVTKSSHGAVRFSNLQTYGWAAHNSTQIPTFIFIKYISSFALPCN